MIHALNEDTLRTPLSRGLGSPQEDVTVAKIIEAGDRTYELVEGWGDLPSGWQWGQVGGVAVDSNDNVHVFTRMEHPYMVFDKNGKMVDRWGDGIFEDAHGICITPDDTA